MTTIHPYTECTLRTGQWCYRLNIQGKGPGYAVSRRLSRYDCVLHVLCDADEILVRGRTNADRIAAAFRRAGYAATVEKGRATIGVRGYYDDVGYDFVAVESADALRVVLREAARGHYMPGVCV